MSGLNSPFPDRKDINGKKYENLSKPMINIMENDYSSFPDIKKIKAFNLTEDDGYNRSIEVSILESQKEFLWTRAYLKEEVSNLNPGDVIKILYTPNKEELNLEFVCFNKKGLDKNSDNEDLNHYNNEDDTKVLCLKTDLKTIDTDDKIKFIRTLFKKSKWYEQQVFRKDELLLIVNGNIVDYIFIDF